jgi:hypothetical protein
MARTTLPGVFTELSTALDGIDVVAKYDHEPGNHEMWRPSALTLFCSQWTPDSWVVLVRLYVEVVEGAEEAQEKLWSLAADVEAALSGAYGPSNWGFEWDAELGLHVGTLTLEVGREDYF